MKVKKNKKGNVSIVDMDADEALTVMYCLRWAQSCIVEAYMHSEQTLPESITTQGIRELKNGMAGEMKDLIGIDRILGGNF